MDPQQNPIIPPDAHGAYFPDPTQDLTGGLPLNLDSLRDGPPGSKPFYPYSTLIRYAIKGSPNQKLLLEDIYYAIESRFPYFRTAPAGWKNSVRHNLSLNPCFEKVPRPLTDRGKGSYWTVNDNVDPRTGVHRIRNKGGKRRGRRKNATLEDDDDDFLTERLIADPDSRSDGGGPSVAQPHPHMAFDTTPPGSFVPAPPQMGSNDAGPSSAPPGAFATQFAFDQPPFIIPPPPGIRFALPPPPLDDLPVDETGNVDWHGAWVRELEHLRQFTEDAVKNDADPEWYRSMLIKVRTAIMMPPPPPQDMMDAPQPPHPPPSPEDGPGST